MKCQRGLKNFNATQLLIFGLPCCRWHTAGLVWKFPGQTYAHFDYSKLMVVWKRDKLLIGKTNYSHFNEWNVSTIISFDSILRFQLSLSHFVEEVKLSPEPNEEHEAVDKVEPNPNPTLAEMRNQDRKKRVNKLSVNCIWIKPVQAEKHYPLPSKSVGEGSKNNTSHLCDISRRI